MIFVVLMAHRAPPEFAQPRSSRPNSSHPQREGTNLGVFVPVWLVFPRCEATNLGVFAVCHFDLLKRSCANSAGCRARWKVFRPSQSPRKRGILKELRVKFTMSAKIIASRPICCLHFGPVSKEQQRFFCALSGKTTRRFEGNKKCKNCTKFWYTC